MDQDRTGSHVALPRSGRLVSRFLSGALVLLALIAGLFALRSVEGRAADQRRLESHALEALAQMYRLHGVHTHVQAGLLTLDQAAPAIDDAARQFVQAVAQADAVRAAAGVALLGDDVNTLVACTRAAAGVEVDPSLAAVPDAVIVLCADGEFEPRFDDIEAQLIDTVAEARQAASEAETASSMGIAFVLIGEVLLFAAYGAWVLRSSRRSAVAGARRQADATFRALVQASHEQVYVIAEDGRVTYASPSADRAWNGRPPETVSQLIAHLPASAVGGATAALASGDVPTSPMRMQVQTVDGAATEVEVQMHDHRDDPDLRGWVVTVSDVTSEAELQRRLRQQALEDELTGLPNRRSVNVAMTAAIARSGRVGRFAGLLLVDLDGFKGVNDTLGHPAGDSLLQQVATRLRTVARAGETVGRIGGDEFAVVLDGVSSEIDAVQCAHRCIDALRQPYDLNGTLLAVNASIGCAVSRRPTDEVATDDLESVAVDDLFRHADIALYEAKEAGRNRVVAFRADMEREVLAAARMQHELNHALAHNELSLVYQPVCSVETGETRGFEALMRWNNGLLGEVPPSTFIPLAERSGLIVELGRWAMMAACFQLAQWQGDHPDRRLTMSVNISPVHALESAFVDDVCEALVASGIQPGDLQLEITESALVSDLERVAAHLKSLRDLGVRVALDDFGTGYSSMGQLQRLPIDCIKIDRSFIAALSTGGESARSVLSALIDLGTALGLQVIAEGVEETDQLRALVGPDCQLAQGYLLAHPMTPWAAEEFLAGRRALHR